MDTRTSFVVSICLGCAAALFGASPAAVQPQSRPAPNLAIGENYRVEVFGGAWNPTPDITVSSEQLGIPGSSIDVVADLGIQQERFRELRLVLRAARKHKFRVQYVPIAYESEAVLDRQLVFNGVRYNVGVPVATTARWTTWRFGYEYDFIYRDRGFLGFIAEAKHTDIEVALNSVLSSEFARARAPIPAIGAIGRVYVMDNIGLTFELTGFKLPENINENYRAKYIDIDVYATLNFSDNVGFQFGYRSIDLLYRIDADSGDLKLKGTYFGGLVRF